MSNQSCETCGGRYEALRPRRARYYSTRCRVAGFRQRRRPPRRAVVYGNNADLIREVSALYVGRGDRIADLTFGLGVFWRRTPHLDVVGSDIVTVPERPYDFRSTPYEDASFDIAVLDPPYIHNPGKQVTDSRYQNAATTRGLYHADIRELYRGGIKEAKRIARKQIWVKCKDEIESGRQR
jgi:hypothetical protein